MMYECHPAACLAADKCQNQRFQLRQGVDSAPFKADKRGWGLKVKTDIKKVEISLLQ